MNQLINKFFQKNLINHLSQAVHIAPRNLEHMEIGANGIISLLKLIFEHKRRLENYEQFFQGQKMNNFLIVYSLVQEFFYNALAESVVKLHIRQDKISEKEFKIIIIYIKNSVHAAFRHGLNESFQYVASMMERNEFISAIENPARHFFHGSGLKSIARGDKSCTTLTECCAQLDACNIYILEKTFHPFFSQDVSRDTARTPNAYLNRIKEQIGFNKKMNDQLGFDFESAVAQKAQ